MALLQDELPDRDTQPGVDVGPAGVLDEPASGGKLPVDVHAGFRLAGEVGVFRAGHEP
jgi:hypothetical protein